MLPDVSFEKDVYIDNASDGTRTRVCGLLGRCSGHQLFFSHIGSD